jgi:hypothetical protein
MRHIYRWPDTRSENRTDRTGKFPLAGHAIWSFDTSELTPRLPGAPSSAACAEGRADVAHWDNRPVGEIHDSFVRDMIFARRSRLARARWMPCKGEDRSAGRAIRIRSQPGINWGNNGRIASRRRRLALFRCTAPPTDRPAVTPTRTLGASLACTTNTTNGWAYDLPVRRTRLKSVDRVRRNLRCTRTSKCQLFLSFQCITQGVRAPPRRSNRLVILPPYFLDMLVGFRGQAIATAQATALEYLAPVCGCHALAKAMYTHAAADFRLIRSFRHILSLYKR